MSDQIVTSDLFLNLSNKEQELLTGGAANFSLNGSNFTNQGAVLMGGSTSGPLGSTAKSGGKSNLILTAAQDFTGLGGELPLNITPLGAASLPNGGTGAAPNGEQPTQQPGSEQPGSEQQAQQ